ncbi:MAG TPA: riboflavin synthase [Chroococcales cyanobacterium]
MFSGIVEEVGKIKAIQKTADGERLEISATIVTEAVAIGDSISVNGVCLTVIEFTPQYFVVEAVLETLRRTVLGSLTAGSPVNLERAMKLSDRLGGHLVSGHIDCVATVSKVTADGFSRILTFELDSDLAPFFVEKGSVAINGVSLTVVDCIDTRNQDGRFAFTVALIPHTLTVTTFGDLKVGDQVNIETDIVARYVARWLSPTLGTNLNKVQAKVPFLQLES